MISFNDNLYIVYRKIREKRLKPGAIEFLKEAWICDTVLKKEGVLLFCRDVSDAQIVTEEEK